MSVWVTPLGLFVALLARSGSAPGFDPVLPNHDPRKILLACFASSFSAPGRGLWAPCLGPCPSPECSSPPALVPRCPQQSAQLIVFLCVFMSYVHLCAAGLV